MFYLISRTCWTWSAEAGILRIHQHAAHTHTQVRRASRVSRNHGGCWYTQYGVCIHSGSKPTAASPCLSALQRCNIRSVSGVVYHIPSVSNWCPFFLIAASLLFICGCWWSSGTRLRSLRTYVSGNSLWGKAWYVKDVHVAATDDN